MACSSGGVVELGVRGEPARQVPPKLHGPMVSSSSDIPSLAAAHTCREQPHPRTELGLHIQHRGGQALFQGPAGVRASFEPSHGEEPTGWHVVTKPGCTQPGSARFTRPDDYV